MADYGFVYCLGNDCMYGIYKIGKTSRPVLQRAQELSSSTSVPEPFDVLFYVETDEMSALERRMHALFSEYRIASNREFFRCSIEGIHLAFDVYANGEETFPMAMTSRGSEALSMAEYRRKEREKNPPKTPNWAASFEEASDEANGSDGTPQLEIEADGKDQDSQA